MSDLRQTLQILRSLQELDRDLYRLREELGRFPQEVLRRRERLENERAKLAEIERKLTGSKVRLKEIEDLTTSQRQRVRKLESEASEARATDAALHVAFQHEIRTLKRDISEAEEEGLALVEESERLTSERNEMREALVALEEEFSQHSDNVGKESLGTRERVEALEAERKKRGGGELPADVLATYEKLLEAREGQAVAELDGRICQGCFVSVPNNIYVRLARCSDLVFCPSCGRILFLKD